MFRRHESRSFICSFFFCLYFKKKKYFFLVQCFCYFKFHYFTRCITFQILCFNFVLLLLYVCNFFFFFFFLVSFFITLLSRASNHSGHVNESLDTRHPLAALISSGSEDGKADLRGSIVVALNQRLRQGNHIRDRLG